MKILYKYILKETYPPAILSLAVFSFILIINLLFQLAELIVEQGFSFYKGSLFFVAALPVLLSYTVPIATLSGVLIAVSRLSSDREITAMKASGVNTSKLLVPLLTSSFFLSVVLAIFNFYLVPYCSDFQDKMVSSTITNKVVIRSLKPKEFFDKIENILLFVDDYDDKNQVYKNLLVYQNPKEGLEILTLAKSAKPINEGDEKISFIIKDGKSYTFKNKTPGDVEVSSFDEQILRIEQQKQTAQKDKPDLTSISTPLLFQLAFGKNRGDDFYTFEYEFFRRIANSIVVIIFILIAFPLGIADIGGGKNASFSISILLILLYWIVQSSLGNLSLKGKMGPFWGAFGPTIIFLLLSIPLNIRGGEKLWKIRERIFHLPLLMKFTTISSEKNIAAQEKGSSLFRRKILDIYITKFNVRFIFITLCSLILLDFIIETRGFIGYLSTFKKVTLLLKYLFFKSFSLLPGLTPFALLIGVLITAAVLERRSELTAIKASGISLLRVSVTFLVIAVIASFTIFALQETVIPKTTKKSLKLKDSLKNYYSRHLSTDQDVWVFSKDDNVLYHYNLYSRKDKSFQGLSIYFLDSDMNLKDRFRAKRALYIEDKTIEFKKGWWFRENNKNQFEYIESGKIKIPQSKDFLVLPENIDAQTLSMRKMNKLIKDLQNKGIKTIRMQVEYYKKIADPLGGIVLVLLGLPFAFLGGRRGSLYGISIALGLSFFYTVFSAIMKSVGQMGWLDPMLSSLFSPLIFSVLGLMALLKIKT